MKCLGSQGRVFSTDNGELLKVTGRGCVWGARVEGQVRDFREKLNPGAMLGRTGAETCEVGGRPEDV